MFAHSREEEEFSGNASGDPSTHPGGETISWLRVTVNSADPAHPDFGRPHNSEVIPQMMSEIVEANLANAQHQTDIVIAHLLRAVSLEDTLDYDEPPDWLAPTRESLGAALLLARKAAEAETVFREDLKRNPRNPRSLFGLAEALKAEGKTAEAASAEQQFRQLWSKADTKLTVLGL